MTSNHVVGRYVLHALTTNSERGMAITPRDVIRIPKEFGDSIILTSESILETLNDLVKLGWVEQKGKNAGENTTFIFSDMEM